MKRRQDVRGTPIEDAPFWVLAIATALLGLVVLPSLVGLREATGFWTGPEDIAPTAAVAFVLAVVLIAGLASLRPWTRRREGDLHDDTPLFARFSTWLIGVVLYPQLVHGIFVLTQGGESIDYLTSLALGWLVSAIQGALAWYQRWNARRGVR